LDSATVGLVWHDDAQVVRLTATKKYVQDLGAAALPGVHVKVWKEEAND
jgi:Holliday junction resolvase RusA-like endonuclease